jgi:hypothetical protein
MARYRSECSPTVHRKAAAQRRDRVANAKCAPDAPSSAFDRLRLCAIDGMEKEIAAPRRPLN